MSSTPDTHLVTDATAHPDIDATTQSTNPTARKTTISGFSVHVKMSSVAGAPIVYLLSDVADHSPVQVPESVNLVTVGVDLWEQNFSPWCAPRVFAKGPNFGDSAQKTFDTLIDQIIPWAESELTEPPEYRVLIGYSLAGLFSLWAGVSQPSTSRQVVRSYQPGAPTAPQLSVAAASQPDDAPITPITTFQRIGAVSGSFWFPGLLDYVDHQLGAGAVDLTHAYLSLGDREARTPNPQIMHVRENAELLANKLKNAGITSTFELNRGNHFQNVERRMQKALDWLLK